MPVQSTSENDSLENCFKSANLFVKTFEEIKIKNVICFMEDCLEKVLFECKCLDQPKFMCKTHVGTHMSESLSTSHVPSVPNNVIDDKNQAEIINLLQSYNSDLKNLKTRIISVVTDYITKIKNDVYLLSANIDAVISKNNQKILDLTSTNLKILENIKQLQSDSLKDLTKQCDQIEISHECLEIIHDEITD